MAKKLVMILGVVFILVAILGFIGGGSVLGIFPVNTLHNLIHLISGLLAVYASTRGEEASVMFSKIFGVVYALVALLGLFAGNLLNGIIRSNGADTVLHIVLALVFLWIGYGMSGKAMASNNNAQM